MVINSNTITQVSKEFRTVGDARVLSVTELILGVHQLDYRP